MSFIVAIDGPAGTGKGTIAKLISNRLKLINIDTGAMYRCVALQMLKENIKLDEEEKIKQLLKNINIDLKDDGIVYLNGIDVTEKIRSKEVSNIVSQVSSIKIIRTCMVEMQRKLGKEKDIVMEGRDIGTVVFPNADVKIYLDADVHERAKRRFLQNKEKNINMSYEEILEKIKKRDENDKNKEIGALKVAKDAVIIDSTNSAIEEVYEKIEEIIKRKREING